MKVRLFLLSLLCSLSIVVAISNSPRIHSQGKTYSAVNALSRQEQDLFDEINQARAHPDLYASYLEKLKPLFAGKIYKKTLETQEGWAAVEDAIAYLRTLKPQGPFTMAQGLNLAAATHIHDQGRSGATGHKSTGSGLLIEDRVKPFGTWEGGIGENLSYGRDSAREKILTWLIDDGFATRGHRKRVMSADYRAAGISCGKHPQYEMMCCLTLAGSFMDSVAAKPAKAGGTKTATLATSSVNTTNRANTNSATTNNDRSNSNRSKVSTKPPK